MLPALQDRFEAALLEGEILELEPADILEISGITEEQLSAASA